MKKLRTITEFVIHQFIAVPTATPDAAGRILTRLFTATITYITSNTRWKQIDKLNGLLICY